MSTIINIANELQALQGRITADKAALLEAKAVLETEHGQVIDALTKRHAKLMDFIDGQIAAKDEAIEGEFREAAE